MIATVVLALAIVLWLWLFVAAVVTAVTGDSPIFDFIDAPMQVSAQSIEGLPSGVRVESWADVGVDIDDPTTEQILLRTGLDLGPLGIAVAVLWLLRRFLRSVLDGDPFGEANVKRLRWIGLVFVVGVPVVELLNSSFRQGLYDSLPPIRGVELGVEGFSLPLDALLAGLGAFILAGVFAYGSRLREDVEATI